MPGIQYLHLTNEFVKPWMEKCNPYLILRYWRHKGCPGVLTLKVYNISLIHQLTPFGELIVKENRLMNDRNTIVDDLQGEEPTKEQKEKVKLWCEKVFKPIQIKQKRK